MVKRNYRQIFIMAMAIFLIPITCRAELGVGVGYPFLSMKYNLDFFPVIGAEAKYSFGDGINVLAGRGYWNFGSMNIVEFFAGYELGNIHFMSEGLEGTGREHGPFLGMEVHMLNNLGISLDISQTMIDINSQNTGLAGSETILNIALYWYFYY